MAICDLKQLIEKLNTTCRRSLEAAAGLCLSRSNYNIEVEHWLLKLLEAPNTDLLAILRAFDADASRLAAELTASIDQFKTGNARNPELSPAIADLAKAAWLLASVDYGAAKVRTGHLLCALLCDDSLTRAANLTSEELDKISPEALRKDFLSIVSETDEATEVPPGAVSETGKPHGRAAAGPTKTPALDQYTIDLTERARRGEIDPVLGRDGEIRQIMDILTRRRQNNPILTGEAGVGKTAVVEGFAQRIAGGDVPPSLQSVALRTLDLGLLQAGAGVKGEFENRLKSVIAEVQASPTPIILFIDEAHTMIGAGGQAGQGDAANLLKPALARGELRTVAATTWAEYKKYFEKDAALARRFQVVKVEEPDEDVCVEMMRGVCDTLERHHKVRILNESLIDTVKLSSRYISGRQLPDKAVSLLDTTCARIGLSQSATPPAVEDCRRRIQQIDVALGILNRETVAGLDHTEKIGELTEERADAESELQGLEERWVQEKELTTQIHELLAKLEGVDSTEADGEAGTAEGDDVPPATSGEAPASAPVVPAPLTDEQREAIRAELAAAEEELVQIQGVTPLVHPRVNSQAVAETVSAWTGIPLGRMVADEIRTVLNLKGLMEESIIGQSHALERIAESIRTSRANLSDPRTPIGVFLLAGPSGVGKTETAITLAELLYGGEQNMTTINMSEFKEEHKVSLLMGSPPGYVGYGEGGVLTEAIRRKPYCVLLLDEMEKAHNGVQDIFYQVFDKGTMKDGEGRDIDFKNTVIIMTTNAATDVIMNLCADPETTPESDAFLEAVFPELLKPAPGEQEAQFKPAFLGRLTVVPYYPLGDDVLKKIVDLKMGKIARRFREHYNAEFSYQPAFADSIVQRCTEVATGARNIDHILRKTLLPQLSAECLGRMADGQTINRVDVSIKDDGDFNYNIA